MKSKNPQRKTIPKLDAEKILDNIAKMRASVPGLSEYAAKRPKKVEGAVDDRAWFGGADAGDEFDLLAVTDALHSFHEDLSAVLEEKKQQALDAALDIFYAAEELAKNPDHPEHKELKKTVDDLRRSYYNSYGKKIPPKEETMRERARRKKS